MTSPYSSRLPRAPHPTPSQPLNLFASPSAATVSTSVSRPTVNGTMTTTKARALRAPIQNPYDKFTKPEFEEWIGGITSALRKALDRDFEEEVPSVRTEEAFFEESVEGVHVQGAFSRARVGLVDNATMTLTQIETNQPVGLQNDAMEEDGEEESDDDVFEDSFAHLKARRKAKGKARDPREGPGFGNRVERAEDDEEEYEDEDEQEILVLSDDEGEEEAEGADSQDEEVGGYDDEDEDEYGTDDGVGRIRYGDGDEEGEDAELDYPSEEEGQEDAEYEEEATRATHSRAKARANVPGPSSSPMRSKQKQQVFQYSGSEEEDEEDGQDQIASSPPAPQDEDIDEKVEAEENKEGLYAPSFYMTYVHSILIPFYSLSAFTTQTQNLDSALSPSPEIVDPWELPKAYAEDLYTGGDHVVADADVPDVLGEEVDDIAGQLENENETVNGREDETQPVHEEEEEDEIQEGTSFAVR